MYLSHLGANVIDSVPFSLLSFAAGGIGTLLCAPRATRFHCFKTNSQEAI